MNLFLTNQKKLKTQDNEIPCIQSIQGIFLNIACVLKHIHLNVKLFLFIQDTLLAINSQIFIPPFIDKHLQPVPYASAIWHNRDIWDEFHQIHIHHLSSSSIRYYQ